MGNLEGQIWPGVQKPKGSSEYAKQFFKTQTLYFHWRPWQLVLLHYLKSHENFMRVDLYEGQ